MVLKARKDVSECGSKHSSLFSWIAGHIHHPLAVQAPTIHKANLAEKLVYLFILTERQNGREKSSCFFILFYFIFFLII